MAGSARFAVAAIVVLAVAARLVAFAAVEFRADTALDPRDYERHALSIAAGDGFPPTIVADRGESALRPPAYPYALGGLYAVTGERRDAARLLQSLLLGVGTMLLLGAVARRLAGRRAALATMALAAVFPPLLVFQGTLLSEALAVPLLVAAVLATLRFRDKRRARWLVAAGVLAGLLVLTRLNAAVIVPMLAAATVATWRDVPWRTRLAAPAALIAVATLTVAPWTVRNAQALDAFVPVSTQAGYTLAGTYNDVSRTLPEHRGAWLDPMFFARQLGAGYPAILGRDDLDEPALDAALRQEAWQYAREHPGYALAAVPRNLARAFGLTGPGWERLTDPAAGIGTGAATVSWLGFVAVLLLAIGGLATRRAHVPPALVAGAALLALSFAITQGEPRFRVLLDPLILLLAGMALANLARDQDLRRTRAP